jgi:hypothetical protein
MNALHKLIALLFLATISSTAFAITDAQVFAYAAAKYTSLFAGTATAGQYLQYDYRYYSASRTYLAVDTNGMVYVMGPYTGWAITPVGTVESLRSAITAWEAANIVCTGGKVLQNGVCM